MVIINDVTCPKCNKDITDTAKEKMGEDWMVFFNCPYCNAEIMGYVPFWDYNIWDKK